MVTFRRGLRTSLVCSLVGSLAGGAALVFLGAGVTAQPARAAELQPWNQEKVTHIANQLEEATEKLWKATEEQPQDPIPNDDSFWLFRQRARLIDNEAGYLDTQLKHGAGRKQTIYSWRDLMQWVEEARNAGRMSQIVTQDILDSAAKVRTLLDQLGPYYDPNWHGTHVS